VDLNWTKACIKEPMTRTRIEQNIQLQ
jgi:hypothetical protein